MVMYYSGQFDEDELIEAYKEHSPIENLFKRTDNDLNFLDFSGGVVAQDTVLRYSI